MDGDVPAGARPRFDEDPETYDRTRPVPPGPVLDDLFALAGLRAGARVVEIGSGTGQATRPLAERGLGVLALEPGPGLAALAAANLAGFPDVDVRCTSFEAWQPGRRRFDAVVACNSFHWLDRATRFLRAAAALRPGGGLALLDTPVVVPIGSDPFWADVQDDWAAVGAERVDPATRRPDRVPDWSAAVRACGLFGEPVVRRHRFDVHRTAEEHAAVLATSTAVAELPPAAQRELVDRVRRRLEARGGRLTVHHLAVLTVAACRP